jgi:putative ABC transport system ATP-binding protein
MSLLELVNISKRYKMGDIFINALDNISLTIENGDYLAIMGPSGSGKSTLMNIIGFLDVPDDGQYIFNNQDTIGLSEKELAYIRNRQVGFIFQTFNLLPRESAIENVQLPLIYSGILRKKRLIKAAEVLDSVNLKDRMNHKPSELSGGERQRVAIARALVNDPNIILADEPTGNLDSKTGNEILTVIDNLNAQGRTILLVTHDQTIAGHANKKIFLKDGKIVDIK